MTRRVLGARSETGFVRQANEDRMGWVHVPYGDVYVISDGMGGYRGGALAAELTVSALQDALAAADPLADDFAAQVRDAFTAANDAVRARREAPGSDTPEMGATGVALVVAAGRFLVAHVGDSRAYLWRAGQLRQLTRDHTRVQALVDEGVLDASQAALHPDASVLDRAIGHRASVEADVGEWMPLEAGDRLLICSDGLSGYVDDGEIAAILAARGTPQEVTDRLIRCALGKGGEDNVTIQLVGDARRAAWRLSKAQAAALIGLALAVAAAGGAGYAWRRHVAPRTPSAATPASAAFVPGRTASSAAAPASPAVAGSPSRTSSATRAPVATPWPAEPTASRPATTPPAATARPLAAPPAPARHPAHSPRRAPMSGPAHRASAASASAPAAASAASAAAAAAASAPSAPGPASEPASAAAPDFRSASLRPHSGG